MPAKKVIKEESIREHLSGGENKMQERGTSEKSGKKPKSSGRTTRREKGKIERKKENRKRKSTVSSKDSKEGNEENQSKVLFGSSEDNAKNNEKREGKSQDIEGTTGKIEGVTEKPGNSGGATNPHGYEIQMNTELFTRKTEEKESSEESKGREESSTVAVSGEAEEKKEEDKTEDKYQESSSAVSAEEAVEDTSQKVSESSEGQQGIEEGQEEERKNEVREKTTDEEEFSPPPPPKKRYIPPRLRELAEFEEGGIKYILLNKVSTKTISELIKIARDLRIQDPSSMRRQELIADILSHAYLDYGFRLYAEGVFQSIDTGSGFLRFPHNNYLQSSDDVFVSKTMIKKYGLRDGDVVAGEIKPPKEDKGKYFSLHSIRKINFTDPWRARERNLFENLIPYYPRKKFRLDWQPNGDISCRVVDIIAPIGKGQRGLIVSPPRAGKTMLLQNIAKAILTNHPEVVLIVLLIDERPEEVTDWKRNIIGRYSGRRVEVIASTFDEKPETHIKVAEIVLAKAKRLVEYKYDVVIFLDSITRLTRAYNQYVPSSGKILTGGIDSAALQFPKKFFGAARAIEGGGSLTILATCLIDTGSRMDEVIFEEFKGTGNMEIYLDRRIAEKRIFPAIDVHRSGTRREELLIPNDVLTKVWLLRKVLQPLGTIDAMELLHEKMSRTKTNDEFFRLLASEG